MAGLGRKVFNAGEVLSAANVQGYLQDQVVQVYSGTAARSSALGTAVSEGMTSYLTDSNELSVYTSNGTAAWSPVNLSQSPNAIINGAFDIWQRGTSFTNFNGSFLADRWRVDVGGGIPTGTISQQTFTAGTAPVAGYEGTYYLRANYTALNSATVIELSNKIEDVRSFAGQTVTLSFWAKADASRSMTAFIRQGFGSGGSGSVDSTGLTASLTTSWQRFTHTVTLASISGKTIGTGSSLDVRFDLPLTAGATTDIWGVQLEAGSVATPFRRNAPSLQGELAACQRYYYRSNLTQSSLYSVAGIGHAHTSTKIISYTKFPVSMRTTPTSVEVSNVAFYDGVNSILTFTSPNIDAGFASADCGVMYGTVSGATAFRPYWLIGNNNISGYVAYNAEL